MSFSHPEQYSTGLIDLPAQSVGIVGSCLIYVLVVQLQARDVAPLELEGWVADAQENAQQVVYR